MTDPIKIDIWSDVACPWCYIGKRRLENALDAFGKTANAPPVNVEYHSFELNPDMPADFPGTHAEYLAAHLGMSAAQVEASTEHLVKLAASVGLAYDMPAMKMTNTLKAHQLLHYAKAHGKQAALKERLLSAHFTEGRHVGRIADLADMAAEVGLDRDDVVRSLEADEYLDAVEADKEQAARYGIGGVPFYVIDGKYGLSGAQESGAFLQALATIAAKRSSAA